MKIWNGYITEIGEKCFWSRISMNTYYDYEAEFHNDIWPDEKRFGLGYVFHVVEEDDGGVTFQVPPPEYYSEEDIRWMNERAKELMRLFED